MQLNAYVFKNAGDVVSLLKKLGSPASELSLLMSDRTAEKAPALKQLDVEAPGSSSQQAAQLSRGLHPLAPLGAPGSGLVGVGRDLEHLHGVGLGSYRDLAATLGCCGLAPSDLQHVVEAVRQGGVLVLGGGEAQRNELRAMGRELTLELPPTAHPAPPPVRAPAAPSIQQHAEQTPAINPPGDPSRNLESR
jgi:hypothetical protein